jgi:hypothetical protein
MKAILDARIVAAKTQIPVSRRQGEVAIRDAITASSQGGFMSDLDAPSPQSVLREQTRSLGNGCNPRTYLRCSVETMFNSGT